MVINQDKVKLNTSFSWGLRLLFIMLLTACGGSDSNTDTVSPITPDNPVIPVTEISDFDQNNYDKNFTSTHFSGSANCATCHDAISDNKGNDLSIVKVWGASMMAYSAKDPLW